MIAAGTWIDNCVGGSRKDRITGNDHANWIDGHGGGDTLSGGGGDDILIGSESAVLSGGTGNDLYYLLDGNIDETDGDGFDRVFCSGSSCYISKGVEVLTFTSAVDANAFTNNSGATIYGNVGDDFFRGGVMADRLFGSAGDDQLRSVGGSDRLVGGDGTDLLNGGEGDDMMLGGNGVDQLFGESGTDTLDGGIGADSMAGGAGNDHYFVNAVGDVVIELAHGGRDLVTSSVAITLAANVEDLELVGAARHGTGNASANLMTGGVGGDYLRGLDGADTLSGMGAGDSLDGGAGSDVLIGGLGADLLTGGAGLDRFVFLVGDSGPDLATSDRVADFSQAEHDRVDLSGLVPDAALTFVGTADFSGVAGEVRYDFSGGLAFVTADLDGDRAADFGLRVAGHLALVRADFILGVPAAPDLLV